MYMWGSKGIIIMIEPRAGRYVVNLWSTRHCARLMRNVIRPMTPPDRIPFVVTTSHSHGTALPVSFADSLCNAVESAEPGSDAGPYIHL